MTRPPVSAVIIARDEAANIARALRSVAWAEERLVVDSGSTDGTREIAASLGARVIQHPWQGYGRQKNYAFSQASHDWVLSLDADECVPADLAREIQERLAAAPATVRAYRLPRKTFYLGRWIQFGGWYPNRLIRLVDRRHARWTEPEVHEELFVQAGEMQDLQGALHHYSFPTLRSQVLTNLKFAELGGRQLLKRDGRPPSVARLLLKPWGKFLECYFLKQGFRDGLPGLIIAINAAYSLFLKHAFPWEDRLRNADPDPR